MKTIVKSIRGMFESIGLFIVFLSIVAVDENGVSSLVSIWNGSISKNGIILTLLLFASLFIMGYTYKNALDKIDSYWR